MMQAPDFEPPIRFEIPPSLNNRMFCAGKRMVLSKRYRAWKKKAVDHLWALDDEKGFVNLPSGARYEVRISLSFRDRRRRDIDGYAKPILDAITESGIAWDDDEQVDYLALFRDEPGHNSALVMLLPRWEDIDT